MLGLLAAACSSTDDVASSPDASEERTSSTPDVPDGGGVTEPQDAAVEASAPIDPCATKNAVCPDHDHHRGERRRRHRSLRVPDQGGPRRGARCLRSRPRWRRSRRRSRPRPSWPISIATRPRSPQVPCRALRQASASRCAGRPRRGQHDLGPARAHRLGRCLDHGALVDGRRIVLVSWYYTPPAGSTYEKGVRVAFVDVTTPATPTYRFALLVEPTGTVAAPNFVPVTVHAGGLVWFGNLLYVRRHRSRLSRLRHVAGDAGRDRSRRDRLHAPASAARASTST